jgi:hypothetical protein
MIFEHGDAFLNCGGGHLLISEGKMAKPPLNAFL